MDIKRLRNLTTGFVHTEIGHFYEDLGRIMGQDSLMTHMLPRANLAVEPWLRKHVTEPRFWDAKYDPTHVGEYDLPEPTAEDRASMLARYFDQPDPLKGKNLLAALMV